THNTSPLPPKWPRLHVDPETRAVHLDGMPVNWASEDRKTLQIFRLMLNAGERRLVSRAELREGIYADLPSDLAEKRLTNALNDLRTMLGEQAAVIRSYQNYGLLRLDLSVLREGRQPSGVSGFRIDRETGSLTLDGLPLDLSKVESIPLKI